MRWNSNVGIVAVEVYIPRLSVEQTSLARSLNVDPEKLTRGLGQTRMSFVGPLEDVNSMGLSALRALLARTGVDPARIGKIDFGTETLHDKSKSSKTVMTRLLRGNHNVEGVTHLNACYGGTAALFDCLAWAESTQGAGRFAVAVMADVAVYDSPAALPTGGAGAVAVLIGPDPAMLMGSLRTSFSADCYDFYKPRMESEYPTVSGAESTRLYDFSLVKCLEALPEPIEPSDYYAFHCPFAKQVEKGFLRLAAQRPKEFVTDSQAQELALRLKGKEFFALETQTELRRVFGEAMKQKLEPTLALNRLTGNIYNGSIYLSLVSLFLEAEAAKLAGKTIFMFSYGSGVCATVFYLKFVDNPARISSAVDVAAVRELFASQRFASPEEFFKLGKQREELYTRFGFHSDPSRKETELRTGSFFLKSVDSDGRRQYEFYQGENTAERRILALAENMGPVKIVPKPL